MRNAKVKTTKRRSNSKAIRGEFELRSIHAPSGKITKRIGDIQIIYNKSRKNQKVKI
jgi:hypothetical protein